MNRAFQPKPIPDYYSILRRIFKRFLKIFYAELAVLFRLNMGSSKNCTMYKIPIMLWEFEIRPARKTRHEKSASRAAGLRRGKRVFHL